MNHSMRETDSKSGTDKWWPKIFGYSLAILFAAATAFYIHNYKYEVVENLILEIDKFGITNIGKEELLRRSRINNLPITYEEKQILINRTVFLGATAEMVQLALGKPKEAYNAADVAESGKQEGIIYVYHFPADARPTLLRFENNKLTHAYKGSTIDVAHQ